MRDESVDGRYEASPPGTAPVCSIRTTPSAAFDAELIDLDQWGAEATDYEAFLEARRAAIATALNESHGVVSQVP